MSPIETPDRQKRKEKKKVGNGMVELGRTCKKGKIGRISAKHCEDEELRWSIVIF